MAVCSFRGGDAFASGIENLKATCESARQAIEKAEKEFGRQIPELHVPRNRDNAAELRLGLLLHLQASFAWTAPKVKCSASADALQYTTGSGLSFGWDHWEMAPGYTFWVKHPSGMFPVGSTLRAALEAAGWQVESYDADGRHISAEEVQNA
jgi:hypothetical protein